ncbi:MAG: DNA-protecting protein DprA [Chloroflexi bacterium]|nr:DNA-protecting protein DprA [Chloroflexota bacterium]
MPSQTDTEIFVAISLIPHVGGKLMRILLKHFRTPAAVLQADEKTLRAVPGIGRQTAQQILHLNVAAVARSIKRWQRDGILILTWDAEDYPASLRQLADAPPVLFKRGNWNTQCQPAVAIVGTREPTSSATQFTQLLAYSLAGQRWDIVSGLARGIDTAAHEGALAAVPDGTTVAVLGSGVKSIYPADNRALAARILDRGALLSEVAPEASPASTHLVARNRLISGLSRGVVMVEAGESSGAFHTVRFAQQQQRPVVVVDLPAAGNQHLIREGFPSISPDQEGIETLITLLSPS